MRILPSTILWATPLLLICCAGTFAADIPVANSSQFAAALAAAQPGDVLMVAPGVYSGGHSRSGLTGVTIRGADPDNRPIFRGGSSAMQLSDVTDVLLQDLVFEQQTGNGLNIDDGGSFDTPSTNLTLRNLTVRDMNASGNNDGIKLSGVTGFLIDKVEVINWAAGGSAIDPVGCHHGLIQNSLFRHDAGASSGIRPKGGSKDIVIRANRFEMGQGAGRAIQAGGSTGPQFFRFIDGDSGYEAAEIVAEGNVVVGSQSPFAYVNIDGGVFHHNYAHHPGRWVMRILNENQGGPIVDTQNGVFRDNIVIYNGESPQWGTAINIGGETLAHTFTFSGNQWYNEAEPGASTPNLPAAEIGGIYGVEPEPNGDEPIVWSFPWGKWIVNATTTAGSVPVTGFEGLKLASPGAEASFHPLAENPLAGTWEFGNVPAEGLMLEPFSQLVLVDAELCTNCFLPGDYNRDGKIDVDDYVVWKSDYGQFGPALPADGNGDGVVDAADFVLWRNLMPAGGTLAELRPVPTPASIWGILWGTSALIVRHHTAQRPPEKSR